MRLTLGRGDSSTSRAAHGLTLCTLGQDVVALGGQLPQLCLPVRVVAPLSKGAGAFLKPVSTVLTVLGAGGMMSFLVCARQSNPEQLTRVIP